MVLHEPLDTFPDPSGLLSVLVSNAATTESNEAVKHVTGGREIREAHIRTTGRDCHEYTSLRHSTRYPLTTTFTKEDAILTCGAKGEWYSTRRILKYEIFFGRPHARICTFENFPLYGSHSASGV